MNHRCVRSRRARLDHHCILKEVCCTATAVDGAPALCCIEHCTSLSVITCLYPAPVKQGAATLQFGNGTLRLTTRQAYQLHGVLKQDLKTVFSSVVKNMGSTLGACGDVNRNVMAPPAPYTNRPEYKIAEDLSNDLADLLGPQSGAYYDVWLDGEKFATSVREVRSVAVSHVASVSVIGALDCMLKSWWMQC